MNLSQKSVGEIVADDYRRAGVLKQYGIDFCCGGGATLQVACEKRGVDLGEIEEALALSDNRNSGASASQATTWPVDFLADYVINVHHTYVRESLPVLQAFTGKVARVHGAANPETVEIARLVDELAEELGSHLDDEERTVFPYVRSLAEARRDGRELDSTTTDSLGSSIEELKHEHEHAGALLREIRTLSGDFTPPEGACATFRAAYAKLEEFEDDLHLHVHLENNVLFPKTAALEAA